jgi:hypothetical protein
VNRVDFEQDLDRADRAPRRHDAKLRLDALRDHAGAPWVDAVLHERLREACTRHGMACPPFVASTLRVGETWLLLAGAAGRGATVRLSLGGEGLDPGPTAQAEARRALQGLLSVAARRGRRVPCERVTPSGFRILGAPGRAQLVGSSLGLSTAVAMLSAALGKPAASTVAGSAVVLPDGRLQRVSHLSDKVRDLRRQWPQVDTLVVAGDQDETALFEDTIRVVRASDLAAACEMFGLSLSALPSCRNEERYVMLAGLRGEDAKPHEAHQWLALSASAWEIARALAEQPDCARDALDALLLAALFASHAGDTPQAQEILEGVPDAALDDHPALRVRKLIYEAAARIDDDAAEAERIAGRAARICADLPAGDRAELTGQALGTQGRAILHGGRAGEAEPLLREAYAHHRRHKPREWPRSACYLATCLRRAGHAEDALSLTREALAEAERCADQWEIAGTTINYLHLERGRALAELDRLADAERALGLVVDAQDHPAAYPRLGAHRSLADVHRRLGRADEARDHLRICVTIAVGTEPPTLRRVGAVAAGEALASGSPLLAARDLENAWAACFSPEVDRAEALRTWIY